jgi:hypothetical protein
MLNAKLKSKNLTSLLGGLIIPGKFIRCLIILIINRVNIEKNPVPKETSSGT